MTIDLIVPIANRIILVNKNKHIEKIVRKATNATCIRDCMTLQVLWSGYGHVFRYVLDGADVETVVVKHVRLPARKLLPKKLSKSRSHKRKLKSYCIENAWYKNWSHRCSEACRVPRCLALESHGDEFLMVLEDLDAAGFSGRKKNASWKEVEACLSWLAHFHATFINEVPVDLWKNGTYWHLDTRPDELQSLDDLPLKKAAALIDLKLKKSPFLTFVHGDAKLENFCFSQDANNVAAVDFQYVGGGCGMKDVAYFVGSCFPDHEAELYESDILGFYFSVLKEAIRAQSKTINFKALEKNWRELYPVAWTDFHRFIKGWCNESWSRDAYSERVAHHVITGDSKSGHPAH